MNRKDIINFFLKKGSQIDPECLDILVNNFDLLESLKVFSEKNELPLIINKEFLERFEYSKVKVLKYAKFEDSNIKSLAEKYRKRFEIIKGFFKDVKNLVSISKISSFFPRFSIIGMVLEVYGRTILVEDLSKQAELILPNNFSEKLEEGDILLFECFLSSEGYKVERVLFPPYDYKKREGKEFYCCFINDFIFTEENLKNLSKEVEIYNNLAIFFVGNFKKKDLELAKDFLKGKELFFISKDQKDFYSLPFWFEAGNKIFLILEGEIDAKAILKKRFIKSKIDPTKNIEPFIIDKLPDFLIICNNKEKNEDYKDIKIFFLPKFKHENLFFIINSKREEKYKIKL